MTGTPPPLTLVHLRPGLLHGLCTVVAEQLYCFLLLLRGMTPVLLDVLGRLLGRPALPGSFDEILAEPRVYAELAADRSDDPVHSVTRVDCAGAAGGHQEAHCTDRLQLLVRAEAGAEPVRVFAKLPARSWGTWLVMSAFDVYRNELDAYAHLHPPIRKPKVLVARWSPSRFCLALEDLSGRVQLPRLWEEGNGCTAPRARSALRSLAALHAHYWGGRRAQETARVWGAAGGSGPYYGKVVGRLALAGVERSHPGLVPPAVHEAFVTALWHWDTLQALWQRDAAGLTTCHGDAHIGNSFYDSTDDVTGWLDLQCVARLHCMRDVTYFLVSSFPHGSLAQHERQLIEGYLSELQQQLDATCPPGAEAARAPSFEECWQQYRIHSFYAMYAFVFSGGFSSELQGGAQTAALVTRCVAQMQRVDSAGALLGLLRDEQKAHSE